MMYLVIYDKYKERKIQNYYNNFRLYYNFECESVLMISDERELENMISLYKDKEWKIRVFKLNGVEEVKF